MAKIKLGEGGYRGRPEGAVCDLGEDKNKELVELGRASWVVEPSKKRKARSKIIKPESKGTYKTK